MKKVKTITLLLLGFAFCILMACSKKEDPDTREQFLGTWKGEMRVKLLLIPDSTAEITMVVTKAASASNKLTFTSDKGLTFTATANGNNFTVDENTTSIKYRGAAIQVTMNGTGAVNGKTMTGSGTFTHILSSGAWSMNLTKQ